MHHCSKNALCSVSWIIVLYAACRSAPAPRPACEPSRTVNVAQDASGSCWIALTTSYAGLDVPCGWGIAVKDQSNQPSMRGFWLIPEPGTSVFVRSVDLRGHNDLERREWLRMFNKQGDWNLEPVQTTSVDVVGGEVECAIAENVRTGRVNASCVLFTDETSFSPLVYVVRQRSDSFVRWGGIDVIRRIAGSGRNLVEGLSTRMRKSP